MKTTIHFAVTLLALCLAACGGGGGSGESATAAPVAPADRRVLLSQYKPGNPAPLTQAQAQAAGDYQFATEPMAAATADAAVVVPALALAQRALLLAAVPAGAQRDDLLALAGDARGLAAGVAQRELQSLAGFSALPEWLQATALGSAGAAAPAAWQVGALAAWDVALGTLPAGFSPSVRVVDTVDARWTWPGAVERFEGVFESDTGERDTRKMLRVSGTVWQLATADFSAQGLALAGGAQLIKLRPAQGAMAAFSRSAALGEALLAINQRLRAGLPQASGSVVLGDLPPELADAQAMLDVQRLGAPQTLPFTLMDGSGHYAELRRGAVSLGWDGTGMRLTGGQELLFIGAGSRAGQSAGVIVTQVVVPPFVLPPACPSAPALRPEMLLLLDAQNRLLWLARLPSQGSGPQRCL